MMKFRSLQFSQSPEPAGKVLVLLNKFWLGLSICALMLFSSLVVAQAQSAHGNEITPPSVPPGSGLEIDAGNVPFLLGHGDGTQNYFCAPCDPTKVNLTPKGQLCSTMTGAN